MPSLNDAGHFEAVRLNSLAQNYVMNLKNLVEYNATLVMEEAIDKIAPTPEIAEYTKAHFYIYVK